MNSTLTIDPSSNGTTGYFLIKDGQVFFGEIKTTVYEQQLTSLYELVKEKQPTNIIYESIQYINNLADNTEREMEVKELKEKLQKLINFATRLGERSKNLSRLLYQQYYEVVELERLEKLEEKERLLETIEKEVELIELQNQKEIANELTKKEFLNQLEIRLKTYRVDKNKKDYWIIKTRHGEFADKTYLAFSRRIAMLTIRKNQQLEKVIEMEIEKDSS
ncbi:6959_t:CDS:2 [Ambispora leptoticha]|uniref:6959_t:CDS:1 n=1 Tax=Ambispora leptoticha TaxID=144679 RepID=A0A9N8V5N3_9GLOM|nr:6959_t:CDS:2 [Ambispora leptoticha]